MFAFKDFTPEIVKKGGWVRSSKVGNLEDAVAAADAWAASRSIEVINIETVLQPVTTRDPTESLEATAITVELGCAQWMQFVRLWYRRPTTSPAIS